MGFNYRKARATSRRQFTFYHHVPSNFSYSLFYRPRKDKRLSRPWSHPAVLNTGPLDWESSALTTRPLNNRFKESFVTSYIALSVKFILQELLPVNMLTSDLQTIIPSQYFNKNTIPLCEICSNLTIKTPEQRQ